ncbi:MAG: PEP-CTERM sorting domain-containing protein [Phycisphaerales bacterium]
MKIRTSSLLVAIAGAAFAATAANADGILTFGYTDTDGDYLSNAMNPTGPGFNGSFTARASATSPLNSSGDVTRLIPVSGQATFQSDFITRSLANAVFNISVENKDNMLRLADGQGDFTITDTDGDTYTGIIFGFWVQLTNGRTFFNGELSNVVFNDNGALDGNFNGEGGTFFDGNLGFPGVYEGAITQVFIRSGVGFFDQSFDDAPTNVEGVIVPTPGAMGLAGLGMLAMAKRRRK